MQIETLKQVLKYLEAYEITRPATYKHLQNLSETMQDIKNLAQEVRVHVQETKNSL